MHLDGVGRSLRELGCLAAEREGKRENMCMCDRVSERKRRVERNSCKSGESSGDTARRRSKIRWNLGEKASAPEERPLQLVIRRFLPAFMRPFHAVFIGKVSPSVRPRERGGGKEEGGGGERKRKEKLAREVYSGTRASEPISRVCSSSSLHYDTLASRAHAAIFLSH